jgi:anaerobic glycerol-3-phosphate dehydrogenase
MRFEMEQEEHNKRIEELIDGRDNGWIQMQDGMPVWPLDSKPEEIRIKDIAHSLALQCRWNGHCRKFYSVAQHSVMVSRKAELECPEAALWGLMHDATEAYMCDIPRPIKPLLTGYKEAENRLAQVICEKYNIPVTKEIYDHVKAADDDELDIEAQSLLNKSVIPWRASGYKVATADHINPWSWEEAKEAFLKRFIHLT